MYTIPKVHICIESIFEANKKFTNTLSKPKKTTRQIASTPGEIDPQSFRALSFATSVVV